MPARKRKYVAELPDATVMDIDGHLVIGRETLQDHVEQPVFQRNVITVEHEITKGSMLPEMCCSSV